MAQSSVSETSSKWWAQQGIYVPPPEDFSYSQDGSCHDLSLLKADLCQLQGKEQALSGSKKKWRGLEMSQNREDTVPGPALRTGEPVSAIRESAVR